MGTAVVAKAAPKAAKKTVAVTASLDGVKKAAVVAATSFALASPAFAATIKLGGDNGELGFYPNKITVSKGEKVEFVNNMRSPTTLCSTHNVPSGVNADALSH